MIKGSFLGNVAGIAETTVWFQAQNIQVTPSMREQTGERAGQTSVATLFGVSSSWLKDSHIVRHAAYSAAGNTTTLISSALL